MSMNSLIFFSAEPDVTEKAWGLIHDFYHGILIYMEKNNISRSDLATKMNKSRSAISQMFNKTPNVSLKKMVELADALNQNLKVNLEPIISAVDIPDIQPAKASFDLSDESLPLSDDDYYNHFPSIPVNSSSDNLIVLYPEGTKISIKETGSFVPDAANG